MILETEDFLRIVEHIRDHAELAIAEETDKNFCTINGIEVSEILQKGLERRFPGLDTDEIEMACKPIIAYLDGPTVMFKYIKDKEKRDYVMQKLLSPEAGELMTSSITRASNMVRIITGFDAFLPEGEFKDYTNALKQLHSSQSKSSDDKQKIDTARNVRALTYKLCKDIYLGIPLT